MRDYIRATRDKHNNTKTKYDLHIIWQTQTYSKLITTVKKIKSYMRDYIRATRDKHRDTIERLL